MAIKKLLLFLFISGNAAFAQQADPLQDDTAKYETILDSSSFNSSSAFEQYWGYFYPWGTDHNGSARMYKKQITLQDGVLQLKATPVSKDEGKSKLDPYLNIRYQSGAVHAKHQVNVTKEYPTYVVTGEFKAPIAPGTWPAFWLTAVNSRPPETDILEFKGDDVNWQNTFITPKAVITIKKKISDAHDNWHTYKAVLQLVDENRTMITYYIDKEKMGLHDSNFSNKPLWLIVNLQMETSFYARKITINRLKANQSNH